MNTYVALLRGINVGGKTTLSMKALSELFTQLGFINIDTYIRSGNIVFSSDKENAVDVCSLITESINDNFFFAPRILVLHPEDIQEAIKENPFPESDPKSVHFGFLWQDVKEPNIDKIEELKKDTEEIYLSGKVFYMYAPEGIGRSKLAANAERLLGVTKTDRNLRTVKAIEAMLKDRQE